MAAWPEPGVRYIITTLLINGVYVCLVPAESTPA